MFQLKTQQRMLSLSLAGALLLMTTACGSSLPEANSLVTNIGTQVKSTPEISPLIQDFSVLSYEEQIKLAENANNQEMKDFLANIANEPEEDRQQTIHQACQGNPDMMQGIRPPRRPGNACGQESRPPSSENSAQPHLNKEAFAAEYPELAVQLTEFKDLEPEARKTAIDALLEEHPDWKEIMPPPPQQKNESCGSMRPGGPPPTQGQDGPPPPPQRQNKRS